MHSFEADECRPCLLRLCKTEDNTSPSGEEPQPSLVLVMSERASGSTIDVPRSTGEMMVGAESPPAMGVQRCLRKANLPIPRMSQL